MAYTAEAGAVVATEAAATITALTRDTAWGAPRREPLVSTLPTDASPPPDPGADECEQGMYGPRGWSVRAGVWEVLAQAADELRGCMIPASHGLDPATVLDGRPQSDYTPFHDLGPDQARRLLEILPPAQLQDRQNLGPTLGSALRACVAGNGRVRLSGYGIGPQRRDERVTVEGMWIADSDLLAFEVDEEHSEGCRCLELWDRVRRRYELLAQCPPDEIRQLRRLWTSGEVGTWVWWD